MKVDNKIKFFVSLGVILFFMLVLSLNTSKAAVITETDIQNILSSVPDSLNLDIPEIEFSQASGKVFANVKKELANNGFTTYDEVESEWSYEAKIDGLETQNGQSIKISIDKMNVSRLSRADFLKATVRIVSNNYSTISSKSVNITYSNTNNYNASDEQAVKSINLTNRKYHEVELSTIADGGNEAWSSFLTISGNYYTSLINNPDIVVIADSQAGDGGINIVTGEGGTYLGIFKNGILYDLRVIGTERSVPVLNIPSTVADEDVFDYVVSKIAEYVPEVAEDIDRIEKGTKDLYNLGIDIPDGYTVFFKTHGYCDDGAVIIKKEEANTLVQDIDDTTNIKLDSDTSVIPANTVLECEKITANNEISNIKTIIAVDEEKFVAYEITLKSNGVEIQPDGSVKISIPIPDSFDKSKLAIYRIGDNGEKIKYNHTISGNYAVIDADHFSTYVIADLTTETNSSSNTENGTAESDNTTTSEESNKDEKKEKDQETITKNGNTPKTGDKVITYFIVLLLAGGIVVVINKKKLKRINKR